MGQTLASRVPLVTGSSRGIGAAIARRLAADGASIITHGSGGDQARTLASEISNAGGNAHAVAADLSLASGPVDLIRSAFEIHGRLDILANNAGVFHGGPIDRVSEEQIDMSEDRLSARSA